MIRYTLLLLAFLLVTASPTSAHGETAHHLDGTSVNRASTVANRLADPPPQTTELENGVRVHMTPYETDGHATVRLAIRAGSAYESASEAGLADVTARWMARRSASTERGAVRLDVRMTPDAMVFSADVAASAVPSTIKRLRDLADNRDVGVTRGSELDAARNETAARFEQTTSVPSDARQQLREALYGGASYGRPQPAPRQIQSYTPADLESFMARFVAPERTDLYVVGSFRPADVLEAATKHIEPWTATATGPSLRVRTPKATDVVVVDRAGRSEVAIAVGAPVVDPGHTDYAALQVATTLIGGGHASRLAQASLPEATSSPYSLLSAHRRTTYWASVVATRPTQTRPAVQAIRRILRDLRETTPDTMAVRRAQTMLIDRFLMQSSTRDGLTEQMMFLGRHDLNVDYFLTYRERLQAVSPSDVQRVVQTYLSPERLTYVVTGPKRIIDPQIAPVERQMP
ncbi:M16 family metallopeptidase [Longibacter sp.]|uniref:M16 family metallopeptidase n=1 Tax=Longibacter sp. TaxID=2045415 RepID=UPI003EB9440C